MLELLVDLYSLRVGVACLCLLTKHVVVTHHFIIATKVANVVLRGWLLRDLRNAVRVAAVEDAVAWVLSDRVPWRWVLLLGRELVASHWTVRGPVRAVFLTAEYLSLLLWDQWSSRVSSLLSTLFSLVYNILSLLNFRGLLHASVLTLNILESLLGLSTFDSAICSSKSATGIIGDGR